MYQGQLCKIQVHKNQDSAFTEMLGDDGGWFLKLKESDGKTMFHLVGRNRTSEMTIDPSAVDESMLNHDPTKPFYVVCVIPTKIQPLALSVSANIEAMSTKACLESKIGMLKTSRSASVKNLESAQKKVDLHKERIAEFDKQIDDLLNITSMPDPYFLYAYGKHSADGMEFAWRIPFEMYGKVNAGDTVMAEAKDGIASVVVTKVERSHFLLEHKLIVSLN